MEDLVAIEGYEDMDECPKCHSGEIHYHEYLEQGKGPDPEAYGDVWRCQNCGFQWQGLDAVAPDMVREIGMRPKYGSDANYR